MAAVMHCDKHANKMLLETTQVLYAVIKLAGISFKPDGLKPYKVTHAHHPCTLWAMACRSHVKWLLNLGLRLSDVRHAVYGTTHKSTEHLKTMHDSGCFDCLPLTVTVDGWKKQMLSMDLPNSVIESCMARLSTINPPSGCAFGVVCVDVEDDIKHQIFAYEGNEIDTVETYRRFYVYKAKRKFPFKWAKQGTPPHWFGDIFKRVLADEEVLAAPIKPLKPTKSAAKPIKSIQKGLARKLATPRST